MSEVVLETPLQPNVASDLRLGFGMRLQKLGLNGTLVAGLLLLLLVIGAAIAARWLTPYDPIAQKLEEAFRPPLSAGHILGTDNFGRDIWSRIVWSTRLDLQIGFISVVFPFVFGSFVGISAGYLGGWVETAFMRVVDVLMAFP